MITVANIREAQAIRDAIHIQRVADGYRVYQVGDELPTELQQQNTQQVLSVTPRQIRLALTQVGLRDVVENAVKAGSQDLKDWWEYALEIERWNPLVVSMGEQLGLSPEEVDDIFIVAESK